MNIPLTMPIQSAPNLPVTVIKNCRHIFRFHTVPLVGRISSLPRKLHQHLNKINRKQQRWLLCMKWLCLRLCLSSLSSYAKCVLFVVIAFVNIFNKEFHLLIYIPFSSFRNIKTKAISAAAAVPATTNPPKRFPKTSDKTGMIIAKTW